jgi:hypothetical protein
MASGISSIGLSGPKERVVYLKYEVYDNYTFTSYSGYLEIGVVLQQCKRSNDIIIRQVTEWLGPWEENPGDLLQYVQSWNIPAGQDIINLKFNTQTTLTDLATNLKIPRHQLTPGKCLIMKPEIILIERPISTTRID